MPIARAILTASSALLVLILAALGCYGTQRYLVTAGQREYAIRSAIGAGLRSLGRLVLSRGMGLALPGLAFGIVLAFIVRRAGLRRRVCCGWTRAAGFVDVPAAARGIPTFARNFAK